jgi:3-oxoacyl-[acyl-carrier-protein] synthase II
LQAERQELVVTGLGAVSALGPDCAALWKAIEDGRDGIGPIRRFSTDEFNVHLGALVAGHDDVRLFDNPEAAAALGLEFSLSAAGEAWRQAAVDRSGLRPERIALVLGMSSNGPHGASLHTLCERLADTLGARGPRIVVSTACSSSTTALGLAGDLLQDTADLVVACGMDLVVPEVFAGFHALGALSAEKCAPFSLPVGTTLGEGAGCVILERREQAERRGVRPFATLLGYGLSGDAYHETSPDPSGAGVGRAITSALLDAGLGPADIGYVKAHGSGTAANDPAEWRALQRVFGERAASMPVSSLKGALGHAQGAAGILEVIVTILSMQHGVVPPTLHHRTPRPYCPTDPVAGPHPRPADVRHAVCINSAFGGANSVAVLSRPGASRQLPPRRPLWVLGAGAVGPYGLGLDFLAKALQAGAPVAARTAPIRIDELIPSADPRGLDPAAGFLTAAATAALQDAGIGDHGSRREKFGLVVGTTRVSPQSGEEFRRSIEARGLARLSAPAFARIVLNAPVGACSKLLALKGPHTAISSGPGSGLSAVVSAAEMASRRSDVELIVAGGVDELPAPDGGEVSTGADRPADGAACVVIGGQGSRESTVDSRPSTAATATATATAASNGGAGGARAVRLAGWGMAGPGRLDDAIERALAMAGVVRREVELWCGSAEPDRAHAERRDWYADLPRLDPTRVLGTAEASSGVVACIAGVLALRERRAKVALVTSNSSRSAECALVLAAAEVDRDA